MPARPALFLCPGLICDARIWKDQIEAFSSDYEVLTPPGFFDFDSLADMARSVLAQAPERFAVAGHSMGARVALEVLALAPERVARIALLDTGAHAVTPDEPQRRQVLLDLIAAKGIEAAVQSWLPPMMHPGRLQDRALMDDLEAMVRRATPQLYARQVHALLNRPDGFTRLPLIKVPCALIVGRQDAWSPPSQHEEMQAQIPGSVLTIIEEAGHMAPAEQPEAVNAAMRAWLEA